MGGLPARQPRRLGAIPQIEVLLIGTVHFANPGLDQFNVTVDDVLAPKRQAEILRVVDALVEFRPTKVAVESSEAGAARYPEYLAGRHELRRNEVEQIGFRVAQQMGHERVFGVDVEHRYYEPAIEELIATDAAHGARWSDLKREGEQILEEIETWLKTGSLGEALYRLNTPQELERAWAPYERLRDIASDENDAGPRMVANWDARNRRIVANLLDIADPNDRLLVIFGQGHIPPMRKRLLETSGILFADPLEYLPSRTPKMAP